MSKLSLLCKASWPSDEATSRPNGPTAKQPKKQPNSPSATHAGFVPSVWGGGGNCDSPKAQVSHNQTPANTSKPCKELRRRRIPPPPPHTKKRFVAWMVPPSPPDLQQVTRTGHFSAVFGLDPIRRPLKPRHSGRLVVFFFWGGSEPPNLADCFGSTPK